MESTTSRQVQEEIFKLQRPLSYTGAPLILAYNESRTKKGQFEATPATLRLFGFYGKIYVMAHLNADSMLEISSLIEPTDEPDW